MRKIVCFTILALLLVGLGIWIVNSMQPDSRQKTAET